mmetsp:Transcript_103905/g.293091  ORF Transcript_103905/g.293091 Transcript_103905/m.293091 type:complete len:257 (-) Transcript_103905:81-851(-)
MLLKHGLHELIGNALLLPVGPGPEPHRFVDDYPAARRRVLGYPCLKFGSLAKLAGRIVWVHHAMQSSVRGVVCELAAAVPTCARVRRVLHGRNRKVWTAWRRPHEEVDELAGTVTKHEPLVGRRHPVSRASRTQESAHDAVQLWVRAVRILLNGGRREDSFAILLHNGLDVSTTRRGPTRLAVLEEPPHSGHGTWYGAQPVRRHRKVAYQLVHFMDVVATKYLVGGVRAIGAATTVQAWSGRGREGVRRSKLKAWQ